MSRLNTLRDDNDPSQTFEGENFMILQQTSNILLGKVNLIVRFFNHIEILMFRLNQLDPLRPRCLLCHS